MKILVTGGSGYLGRHIRKYFQADDLSRSSGADVLDIDDVRRVADYDLVIHLAARLSKDPASHEDIFRTNVDGTINVLREMKKDAVFVFASTKDVYGRFADQFQDVPETCSTAFARQAPLEWSKLIAERYVEYYAEAREFRACIFRLSTPFAPAGDALPTNFVGGYADAINKGEPIKLPASGAPVRDLLHVDDLCRAIEAFGESVIRNGLYNLGGGRQNALSLKAIVDLMSEVSGYQAIIDESAMLPPPTPYNYVSDLTRVGHELGWSPTTTLEEGLTSLFSPAAAI